MPLEWVFGDASGILRIAFSGVDFPMFNLSGCKIHIMLGFQFVSFVEGRALSFLSSCKEALSS